MQSILGRTMRNNSNTQEMFSKFDRQTLMPGRWILTLLWTCSLSSSPLLSTQVPLPFLALAYLAVSLIRGLRMHKCLGTHTHTHTHTEFNTRLIYKITPVQPCQLLSYLNTSISVWKQKSYAYWVYKSLKDSVQWWPQRQVTGPRPRDQQWWDSGASSL